MKGSVQRFESATARISRNRDLEAGQQRVTPSYERSAAGGGGSCDLTVVLEAGTWDPSVRRSRTQLVPRCDVQVPTEQDVAFDIRIPAIGGGATVVGIPVQVIQAALDGSFLAAFRCELAVGISGEKLKFEVRVPDLGATFRAFVHRGVLGAGSPVSPRWCKVLHPVGTDPGCSPSVNRAAGQVFVDVPAPSMGGLIETAIRTLACRATRRISTPEGHESETGWFERVSHMLAESLSRCLCSDLGKVSDAPNSPIYLAGWVTVLPDEVAGLRQAGSSPESALIRIDLPDQVEMTRDVRERVLECCELARGSILRPHHTSRSDAGLTMTFSQRDAARVLLAAVRSALVPVDALDLRITVPGCKVPVEFRAIVVRLVEELGMTPPGGGGLTAEIERATAAALRDAVSNSSSWEVDELVAHARRCLRKRLREIATPRVLTSASNALMAVYLMAWLEHRGLLTARKPGSPPSIAPEALGIQVDEVLVNGLVARLLKRFGFEVPSTREHEDPVSDTAVEFVAQTIEHLAMEAAADNGERAWSRATCETYVKAYLLDHREYVRKWLVDAYLKARFVQETRGAFEALLRK